MTNATHTHPDTALEYFVEYYPNEHEGEQAEELTKVDFEALINDHKARGLDPVLSYETFSIFENGRSGPRLTIIGEYGVFYD